MSADKAEAERLIMLAFRRLKRADDDPALLPDLERNVVLVASAQGIIGNGGFQYFFESDFPGQPSYAVFSDAYRAIGATSAAACIDRAVAMFPFRKPERSQKRRDAFMESLPEEHEFFELEDRVCVHERVWETLDEYVLANRHELQKPLSRRKAVPKQPSKPSRGRRPTKP